MNVRNESGELGGDNTAVFIFVLAAGGSNAVGSTSVAALAKNKSSHKHSRHRTHARYLISTTDGIRTLHIECADDSRQAGSRQQPHQQQQSDTHGNYNDTGQRRGRRTVSKTPKRRNPIGKRQPQQQRESEAAKVAKGEKNSKSRAKGTKERKKNIGHVEHMESAAAGAAST